VSESLRIPVGLSFRGGSLRSLVYASHVSRVSMLKVHGICSALSYPGGEDALHGFLAALGELGMFEDFYEGRVKLLLEVSVKDAEATGESLDSFIEECISLVNLPGVSIVLSSGKAGEEPEIERAEEAAATARELGIGLIIGSGVAQSSIPRFWHIADGFIAGTSIKVGGVTANPISEERARALIKMARHYRKTLGCK